MLWTKKNGRRQLGNPKTSHFESGPCIWHSWIAKLTAQFLGGSKHFQAGGQFKTWWGQYHNFLKWPKKLLTYLGIVTSKQTRTIFKPWVNFVIFLFCFCSSWFKDQTFVCAICLQNQGVLSQIGVRPWKWPKMEYFHFKSYINVSTLYIGVGLFSECWGVVLGPFKVEIFHFWSFSRSGTLIILL